MDIKSTVVGIGVGVVLTGVAMFSLFVNPANSELEETHLVLTGQVAELEAKEQNIIQLEQHAENLRESTQQYAQSSMNSLDKLLDFKKDLDRLNRTPGFGVCLEETGVWSQFQRLLNK